MLKKFMKCYIYRSTKKQNYYLYLAKKDNFKVVPRNLSKALGELAFSFDFNLESKKRLARENLDTVKDNLKKQGYHIQVPPKMTDLLSDFNGNDSNANPYNKTTI